MCASPRLQGTDGGDVPGKFLLEKYNRHLVIDVLCQNVNPGLARRFAIEHAFTFEDFNESQLMEILDYKLKSQDLYASDEAKQVVSELLSRMKNRPNFGNAGEVENILSLAKSRYQKRMASSAPSERKVVRFEPQDFDPDFKRGENSLSNLQRMFADVVGSESVIEKLARYQKIAQAMKAAGRDMRTQIPCNFIFKGPPGECKHSFAMI